MVETDLVESLGSTVRNVAGPIAAVVFALLTVMLFESFKKPKKTSAHSGDARGELAPPSGRARGSSSSVDSSMLAAKLKKTKRRTAKEHGEDADDDIDANEVFSTPVKQREVDTEESPPLVPQDIKEPDRRSTEQTLSTVCSTTQDVVCANVGVSGGSSSSSAVGTAQRGSNSQTQDSAQWEGSRSQWQSWGQQWTSGGNWSQETDNQWWSSKHWSEQSRFNQLDAGTAGVHSDQYSRQRLAEPVHSNVGLRQAVQDAQPKSSKSNKMTGAAARETIYDLEEECWEYLDNKAVKQGPFSGAKMLRWFEHNMLREDLGVRYNPDAPFTPIKSLFHTPFLPFRSKPKIGVQTSPDCWEYLDPLDIPHGPFSDGRMALWYSQRMLPDNLRIRHSPSMAYTAIWQLFHPPLLAFKSHPTSCCAQSAVAPSALEAEEDGVDDEEEDDDVEEDCAATQSNAAAASTRITRDSFPVEANMRISPFDIRFSQERANYTFRDGRPLEETIPMIRPKRCEDWKNGSRGSGTLKTVTGSASKKLGATSVCWLLEFPFPPIQVLQTRCKLRDENGRPRLDPQTGLQLYDSKVDWFTLDNRRLYCMQRAAIAVWPDRALIEVVELPPGALTVGRQLRKFRTLDRGRSINVGARGDVSTWAHWSWRKMAGLPPAQSSDSETEGRSVQMPRGVERSWPRQRGSAAGTRG